MPIAVPNLIEVMKFQIKNLGKIKDPQDDTVHKEALGTNGPSGATPRDIYKAFIRFTLVQNGGQDQKFPSNWLDLTIAELAEELLSRDM